MYHLREWWVIYVSGLVIVGLFVVLFVAMKAEEDRAAIECGNAGGTILEAEYDDEGYITAWWCLDNNRNVVSVPEWG